MAATGRETGPLTSGPKKQPRSKFARVFARLIALAAAGSLSVYAATAAADFLQERLGGDVRAALHAEGYDWAKVEASGLQVHVTGTAPDEVRRYRAIVIAQGAIEAGKIIDDMEVAPLAAVDAPDFKIELLRNDQGVSIIGLVPAATDRAAVVKRLTSATGGAKVTDLLEAADYAVPETWQSAFDFGIKAAEVARRSKITIEASSVTVSAIADSREDKAAIENALKSAKPKGLNLVLDVAAPRAVIAPFTLRFVKDEKGARFDACAADTEEARHAILEAGTKAGASDQSCQLGLGAPTADWSKAAVGAIGAVQAFGGGSATLSDTDVALLAPSGTPQPKMDEVVARLQTALPEIFSLKADIEQGGPEAGPADFSAGIGDAGNLILRGRITDRRMRDAVESFARARFGTVDSALRIDPGTPSGWTVRVIAALEVMADLQHSSVRVTPDIIRINGTSGDRMASDFAATKLAERLGAGANYELAIRYDRRLDPTLGLPSGQECVDRLNIVMRESIIGFEPNKSIIAGDPSDTLKLLKSAMGDCGEFRIEIGGHTDSQGSDNFNAELSRKRAQAILTELGKVGVDTRLMTARGYGESEPIADNETDAGREANRRIEFKLLAEEPVETAPAATPKTVTGVTTEPLVQEVQGPPVPDDGVVVTKPEDEDNPPDSPWGDVAPPPDASTLQYAEMVATVLVSELTQTGFDTDNSDGPDGEAASGSDGEVVVIDPLAGRPGPAPLPGEAANIDTGASDARLQSMTAPNMPELQITSAADAGPLAEGEEGGSVQVLTPDANTPRPSPRPAN